MGRFKCCVGNCRSTSETHRLFYFPKNDYLRKLWMSFLVPTNSSLIGLTSQQLLSSKRVCEKHFDSQQFDAEGRRIRFSYPCLLSDEEIAHGEPSRDAGVGAGFPEDHNYYKLKENNEDELSELVVLRGAGAGFPEDHNYYKLKENNEDELSELVVLRGAGAGFPEDHNYYKLKENNEDELSELVVLRGAGAGFPEDHNYYKLKENNEDELSELVVLRGVYLIRLHVHNWCNIINKILKGSLEQKYVSKMGEIQKLAYKKYVTNKLRRKVLNK